MSRPSASSDAAALLRTPRWIGLTLLLIALTALFAVASSWQYNRAIDQVNAERAANARPEPIDALVPDADQVPPASLGRLAVVSGQYRGDAWVAGRASPSGEPGWWLVCAVDDGSGLLTPVLRGWLAEREPSGPAPWRGQQVTVTGRVSSAENFYTGVEANQPDELVAITNERLAAIWQQPMRAGYLVVAEQHPPLAAGTRGVLCSSAGLDFAQRGERGRVDARDADPSDVRASDADPAAVERGPEGQGQDDNHSGGEDPVQPDIEKIRECGELV